MTTSMIDTRLEGRILIATLNRDDAANGINTAMAEALEQLADQLASLEQVDALVLTGKGRVFCSGGDVAAFKDALGSDDAAALPALLNELSTRIHAVIDRLVNMGPLLVAAVNGPATGAGLGLLCACDVAYGRATSTLRPGFSRLGLSPDTGVTYFLPRIVGYRKALDILLRGEAVTPQTAQQLGIFSELIEGDDEAFISEVLTRTRTMIASGDAVQATRRLLSQSASAIDLRDQLAREQRDLVNLASRPLVSAHIRKTLGL